MRIPVFHGARVIELADAARARRLAKAPNASIVRRRKTGQIVRINLRSFGDDSGLPDRLGNPNRLCHDHETEHNPPRVWTFRRIPAQTRRLYRAAIEERAVAA